MTLSNGGAGGSAYFGIASEEDSMEKKPKRESKVKPLFALTMSAIAILSFFNVLYYIVDSTLSL